MRKILLSLVLTVIVIGLAAQNIREEIRDNIRCSAGNYLAYPGPTQLKLTPAPEGKHPFYISAILLGSMITRLPTRRWLRLTVWVN